MTRAHFVKKARKNYPSVGIKKGDSYWWWKFRRGGKHYSKIHPRPSQLTQSVYLSTVYALQEQIEDINDIDPDDVQTIADKLRSVADELRNVGQDQEDKIRNMPDSLQSSQVADLLQQRTEACERVAQDLESAADEIESIDSQAVKEANDDELICSGWLSQNKPYRIRVEDIIDNIRWDLNP